MADRVAGGTAKFSDDLLRVHGGFQFAEAVQRRAGKGTEEHMPFSSGVETQVHPVEVFGHLVPIPVERVDMGGDRCRHESEILGPVGVAGGLASNVVDDASD